MKDETFRTIRAAAVGAVVAFALFAGFGWLLGFPVGTSIVAGVVAAVLSAALVVAAAFRAGTFDEDPTHEACKTTVSVEIPPHPDYRGEPTSDEVNGG